MTTPDDTNEARGASSGTTRTPPPRTRRGSMSTRASSMGDVDDFDGTFAPEPPAAEPVAPSPTKRGRSSAASSTGFAWETPDEIALREAGQARATTTNRDATLAAGAMAAEVYGDPVEPEIAFEPASPRPAKPKAAPSRSTEAATPTTGHCSPAIPPVQGTTRDRRTGARCSWHRPADSVGRR